MTVTRREAIKVDEWVAFFGDYRDLSTGLLYQKGKEPQAFLNIASVFEVVNKMHLDMALRDIAALETALKLARDVLQVAKDTIYAMHGPTAWDLYQLSPEMKQINNALKAMDKITGEKK